MKRSMPVLLACLALMASASSARAQQADTTETVRVILTDGTELVGTIIDETKETITVRTRSNLTVTVERVQIARIISEDTLMIGGNPVQLDPNLTRLFFAPTGRSLARGEGYIADYYLFFPFVAYGPGYGINLAGGISIIPGTTQLLYLAPKVTVLERDRQAVAVGTLLITPIGSDADIGLTGLFYGIGTFGSDRTALTAGIGFGMVDGDVSGRPTFVIGAEHQLSGNLKLISENYLVFTEGESGQLISGGLRFFGDRLAADLALITSPQIVDDIDGFPFFPFVSFAYNFGR